MMKPILSLSIIACALLLRGACADTATFSFAPLGNSYSAAMFADDPLVGKNVSAARIYLQIECFPGSDAANFFTDISLPIDPLPGGDSTLVLSGEELGWSGAGQFSFFEETNRFNGTIIPGRYGAESPSEDFVGVMLDGRIEFDIADYVIGDFDGDSELNHADIDWLSDAIILGNFSRTFDLNLDGLVDLEDHRIWVHDLKHSWYGDADLNGQFNSSDLVAVLQAGQYLEYCRSGLNVVCWGLECGWEVFDRGLGMGLGRRRLRLRSVRGSFERTRTGGSRFTGLCRHRRPGAATTDKATRHGRTPIRCV